MSAAWVVALVPLVQAAPPIIDAALRYRFFDLLRSLKLEVEIETYLTAAFLIV